MKDSNPRIFRSLEKAGGLDEFDTIVTAAVSTYGAVRHPSESKAREFAHLVLPVWHRLKPETRRALGAALSHSANVPRGVVEKLLAEPIEISAPFLLSSPVLTETDRLHLAESRDSRLRKIALGSVSAKPSVATVSRQKPVQAETMHEVEPPLTKARENAAPQPPEAEEKPRFEPGMAAAAVRDALRRMVKPGRPVAAPALPATPADIVQTAVEGDAETTLSAIGALAGLDTATLLLVSEDEGGERLAVALKAIGMRDADAMTVMMMVKPKIGLDVAAFDMMARYYRSLNRDDCTTLLGMRRQVKAPKLEPMFEDIERMDRPAARTAFGRRTERPESKSREA